MKKRFLYRAFLILFVAASAFMLIGITNRSNKDGHVYIELLPRKASLAYTAEWAVTKNNVEVLIRKIKETSSNMKSLLALTALYIQEARITGNLNYYNEAALKCITTILEKDPKNFEALTFKSTILLSQHRFADGLIVAAQAQQLYPYNAYVYGLLVDGYVESGKYREAIEAADKMISIRPDSRSYSRIAYLREIHGDIPGAIEAMNMAVDAGAAGEENTEWCRVQLGKLFEKIGNIDEAKMHYTIAVNNRQNYPYALAGLARIATEEKDYTKALGLYQQADSLIPDHLFKEGIADVYNLTGQSERAKEVVKEILNDMKNFSAAGEDKVGQNEDHEMAHAYMGVNDYEKALEFALLEHNRRPANIEVNETVAMVYYGKAEYTMALPYIETALKTNCKNPELLGHAGLIYAKSGNKAKARMFLNSALKNNPVMSQSLKNECEQMMESLN
ncbi:MAG TPA: tetratricopeptide repeat protein [Chitinophagaceae bacterium]|nr:tetratricopeptide repeat protein [Chitinophagaceae bacterium]